MQARRPVSNYVAIFVVLVKDTHQRSVDTLLFCRRSRVRPAAACFLGTMTKRRQRAKMPQK
jgi:hypothetical protein